MAKKTSKPKKRPTNKNKPEQEKMQLLNQQPETSESSELDQVAKKLFINQKTATVEFNDPQIAIEFAMLISKCQQLREVMFLKENKNEIQFF